MKKNNNVTGVNTMMDHYSKEVREESEKIITKVMNLMIWPRDKAELWYKAKNPNFGGMSPEQMVLLGREKKVWTFIKNAEEENF